MEGTELFKYADFARAGISRVEILNNTDMGRWMGSGPLLFCYRESYMKFTDSMASPGTYFLRTEKNNLGKKQIMWEKTNMMRATIDVEDVLSRFDSLGVELMRDEYMGNAVTIDHKTSTYFKSSVRKCYILRSRQELAGISTRDKIIVRKTYFDLIYNMWGSDTVVFGKASYLPVIFGKYDDDVNFKILGILMPIDCEHRRFEENINNFTKAMWEGVKI